LHEKLNKFSLDNRLKLWYNSIMINITDKPFDVKKFLYEIQDTKNLSIIDENIRTRKNVLDLKIVVMIDVSGSISQDEFTKFFLQIDKIRGLSVVKVLEFSVNVSAMYDYFNTHQNEVMRLSGGGGTSFVDVFKTAKRMNPDAIILMTDGDDCGDLVKNPEIPTAVVLTENGKLRYDWMKEIGRIKGVKKINDDTHNEIDTDMKADNEALSSFEDEIDEDEQEEEDED